MSTASSTDGSSSVVATGPVWPPPSPPWTITASAPQPATFFACLAAPTDGITTTPASLSFAIRSGFGASANDATLHALADQQIDAIDRIARVGADVDAERLVRRGLHLADRGLQLVERHGCRRQDAQAAGVGCRRHQPRTRHPAHPGLHHRMFDTDQFGQRSAQPASVMPYFLVPQRLRIDHLADQLQLVARSAVASVRPRPGRVPRTRCSRCTSSGVIPGCSDTARI